MTTEIWKPVVGYEGYYEVSNKGRVKSLDRVLSDGRKWSERILTPIPKSTGHLTVRLSAEGVSQTKLVHQLVLEAFVGPRPEGYHCRHGERGVQDNSLNNLCYGSRRENLGDDRNRDRYPNKLLGAIWHKRDKKWMSQIKIEGKTKFLGYFQTEQQASDAYQKARREIET